jgi:Ca-activated chloride channel homolog
MSLPSAQRTRLRGALNPRVARVLVFVVGVMAIISTFVFLPAVPVVEVPYVIATDAVDLIAPMVEDFNGLHEETDGSRIHVTWSQSPSGRAVSRMVDGGLEPVAWTPGSSLWADLLNAKAPTKYVVELGPTLVESPQVVAMFRTRADELGFSSSDRLERVLEEASAGHLKFGHTDPNVSTSGLSAVLSEFYLASEKSGDRFRPEDVLDPRVRARVRRWERSVVHYVDIGKDFKDLWCQYGSPFADAAYMQETTLLEFNRVCHTQLVGIYPTDAPLVADYRYIVLHAPWVSPKERSAAEAFGQWLERRLSEDCPAVADKNGFRKRGCVPSLVDRSQPKSSLAGRPDSGALAEVQKQWGELRRPANVMLVVDQTIRMADRGKLASAKEAFADGGPSQPPFLECPRDQDRIGMVAFGGDVKDPVRQTVPLGTYSDARQRDRLKRAIGQLASGRGRAALYDAIDRALSTPGMLNPDTVNTIIVVSVGVDDRSSASITDLEDRVRQLSASTPVQILLVPYSDPRTLTPLTDLVAASLGRTFDDKDTATAADDATDAKIEDVSKFVCQFL